MSPGCPHPWDCCVQGAFPNTGWGTPIEMSAFSPLAPTTGRAMQFEGQVSGSSTVTDRQYALPSSDWSRNCDASVMDICQNSNASRWILKSFGRLIILQRCCDCASPHRIFKIPEVVLLWMQYSCTRHQSLFQRIVWNFVLCVDCRIQN